MAVPAEDLTFDDLAKTVEPMTCKSLTNPVTLNLPTGIFNPITLPLQELSSSDNPSVHLFDIIANYREQIDFDKLQLAYKQAMVNHDLSFLPSPFGLRTAVPKDTKMQLFICTCGSDVHYIVKHFIFSSKCKASVFMGAVFGKPHIYRWRAANPVAGKKILQYCLENLGGHQMKIFELQSYAKTASGSRFEDLTDADIDKGFDYIQNEGPRSSSEMQQLRWLTKATKNSQSPICGWPTCLIEKALRNLSTDGALAKKEYQWPIPLTTKYFHPWVLDILEKVWDFDVSALMLLGEAGSGKSPLGRSVLMAQARHNQIRFNTRIKPCVRCTPEIDFLRGEQGCVTMGDFLDDTHMNVLTSKLLKSILDVGLYEAMSWARWGAVKWVQNQPRAIADNSYDEDYKLDVPDFVPAIDFEKFIDLIKPAFRDDITKSHMNAVLKRSVILLNTSTHVYYRMAGINKSPVQRINLEDPEFLTQEGKTLYGAFKNGSRLMPDCFQIEVRKEQEWVSKLIEKRLEERRPDHAARVALRRGLWGESPRPEPIFRQIDRANVRVKREREEEKAEVITPSHIVKHCFRCRIV